MWLFAAFVVVFLLGAWAGIVLCEKEYDWIPDWVYDHEDDEGDGGR